MAQPSKAREATWNFTVGVKTTPQLKDGTTPIEGRCGYGPRIPIVVVSPYAKENFVDHTLADQSSILRFIEENWGTTDIGGGSFDTLAGRLNNMFDFGARRFGVRRLFLEPDTGA